MTPAAIGGLYSLRAGRGAYNTTHDAKIQSCTSAEPFYLQRNDPVTSPRLRDVSFGKVPVLLAFRAGFRAGRQLPALSMR